MKTAVVVLLVGSTGFLAACNRLSFVRPDTKRGHYEQVAHEVRIDPKNASRNSAFTLTQLAQARLLSGDATQALDAARRAVKLDATSATANSLAALSLDALGRSPEAGPYHRRAVELAPERGELLNNYGTWLCTNGQAPASLDFFDRAAAAPDYATPAAALANAGACARDAGQIARAQASARRALELDPGNALALGTLARVAFQAGRGLEARAFVERRLAAGPADADTLLLASQIEQSLGDTDAAARYVQRLRTEFPPNSRPSGDKR